MRCKDCHQARRFADGAAFCVIYGMIINEEHECTREGWKIHDEDDDQRGEGDDEAEIRRGSGGAAGEGAGVLSGYGE